jgi:hypothetical protein
MIAKGDKLQYRFQDPDDNGNSWQSMYELMRVEHEY